MLMDQVDTMHVGLKLYAVPSGLTLGDNEVKATDLEILCKAFG